MGSAPYMFATEGGKHSLSVFAFIYEREHMLVVCTCSLLVNIHNSICTLYMVCCYVCWKMP